MNVVFLPAWASSPFASAVTDGALCFEGPCLIGWAWTLAALTLLSAWLVRRWPAGGDMARRLLPAGASVAAIVPQRTDLAPGTRQAPARPRAVLAAAGHALRAPPTTDMVADTGALAPRPAAPRSSPSLSLSRSSGTPSSTLDDSSSYEASGRPSPA